MLSAFRFGAVAILGLALAACTSTIAYNPNYVSAGLASPAVTGAAAVVMTRQDQEQSVTAHPTSYTGSATSITAPVGVIIREAALQVFGKAFSQGAMAAEAPTLGVFGIKLKLDDFTYKYDQLSTLGFEIKPKVTVALTVEAISPSGAVIFSKRYERSDYLVGAYVIAAKPEEKINEALHRALAEIFRDVVDDVVAAKARS